METRFDACMVTAGTYENWIALERVGCFLDSLTYGPAPVFVHTVAQNTRGLQR